MPLVLNVIALFLFWLCVAGTTLNYFLDDKINKAEILFPGVGCFLIAVCLGSAVHSSNSADNKAKLEDFSSDHKDAARYVLFVSTWYPQLNISALFHFCCNCFWIISKKKVILPSFWSRSILVGFELWLERLSYFLDHSWCCFGLWL